MFFSLLCGLRTSIAVLQGRVVRHTSLSPRYTTVQYKSFLIRAIFFSHFSDFLRPGNIRKKTTRFYGVLSASFVRITVCHMIGNNRHKTAVFYRPTKESLSNGFLFVCHQRHCGQCPLAATNTLFAARSSILHALFAQQKMDINERRCPGRFLQGVLLYAHYFWFGSSDQDLPLYLYISSSPYKATT